MSGEELKEKSEELAKAIGSMPNAEQDERLRNLTQFLNKLQLVKILLNQAQWLRQQ